jgi:glutathione S-transferase
VKLYDFTASPNCRRVRIFLAEKGIRLDLVNCFDIGRLRLTDEYLERYSFRLAPMLELENGSQLGESTAICRYLEELHPAPALLGSTALEKAVIEMWQQRIHAEFEIASEEIWRNTAPPFANRGLAGTAEPVPQIPALADRGKARIARMAGILDNELARNRFVCGDHFSMADISLLCALDFARFTGVEVPEGFPALMRWYETVCSRPSARN